MIQLSTTILPPSTYAYTVEPFFYFNLLWRIREVDRACYTVDTVNVADIGGARIALRCIPMSATRIITFLSALVHEDDWVDLLFLDGRCVRNIQRIQ